MKTMLEYAILPWDNEEWIDPISDAVIDHLTEHQDRTFSTAQLVTALGVTGLRNAKAIKAFGGKLAALRKPGEALENYWSHSATRFAPFKDKNTGERLHAIDWKAPVEILLTNEERLAKIKATDPDLYASLYAPKVQP